MEGKDTRGYLTRLAQDINAWAEKKGWNVDLNATAMSIGVQVSNFHSEITEAWEEIRSNRMVREIYYRCKECGKESNDGGVCCEKVMKPEGFPIELADLMIRVLHTCGFYGIDLETAIMIKMQYNETREYRHGGKRA